VIADRPPQLRGAGWDQVGSGRVSGGEEENKSYRVQRGRLSFTNPGLHKGFVTRLVRRLGLGQRWQICTRPAPGPPCSVELLAACSCASIGARSRAATFFIIRDRPL
jgi:hypothetical protein